MDSDYLRQMSLQNAQLALDQAKFRAQYQIESDELWSEVAKRINGGGNSDTLLDMLRREFENKSILTIQNIERIVGERFMVRGMVNELYSFNDYPGRYEYWFWYRPIGSVGRDRRIVLKRNRETDSKGDGCYKLLSAGGPFLLVHPNELKTPKGFIEILENYTNL